MSSADSHYKTLRFPELSFHQYLKTSVFLYHISLSVSAKSSFKWFWYCWVFSLSALCFLGFLV